MKIVQKYVLLFSIMITGSIGVVSYFIFQYVQSSLIDSQVKQLNQMMSLKGSQMQDLAMHRTSMLSGVSTLTNLKFIIVLMGCAIIGGGIWIVFFLTSRITRPLKKLAAACKVQSIGNLQKIDIKTSDEVSNVVDSLNYLIEKVSEDEKDLRKVNAELTAMEIIERNLEKLDALVNDVLDCYKLDIGRLKLSKVDTDVGNLINQTILDSRPLTVEKQIELKPDIKMTGTILCDPKRIEQVLSNLINNSIDFVPEKDGKIIVRVEKGNDSQAIFAVEDNGIGISSEKAGKLFQKFYQIDTSATRKHSGTGLGLSICKGIVEAHGGRIWIDKTYVGGTAIKFNLPGWKSL
jgi:signal transduction histidine kinase